MALPKAKLLSPLTLMVVMVRTATALGRADAAMRVVMNKGILPRKTKVFNGWAPAAHDVFATVFPKSGTNWTMQLCLQIAHRGAAEFEHIHDLVCWPESPAPGMVSPDDPGPLAASPTKLRVIKTHLDAEVVPYSPEAKYVTIIRDPKEVVVSTYHFVLGMFGILDRVTPKEWVEMWMHPEGLGSRWAEHTAGFWALRERPNVCVSTYNELKARPRECVQTIAELLGVELDPTQLDAVVERISFAYMKKHSSKFAPPNFPLSKPERKPEMIRRGQVGKTNELLDAEDQRRIDELARAQLDALGSDFPFDELFGAAS